jgi:hypothetical protein
MEVNEILLKEEVISLNTISDIVNTVIQTVSTEAVTIATIVTAGATIFYARLAYVLLREQRKEKKRVTIQEITWFIISPVMHTLKGHIECLKKRDYWWNSNTPHWCFWGQLLEIIVNNRQLKPDHHYYEFWKRYGGELAEFREREEVKNYKEWIEEKTDSLLALSENIYKSLEDRLMKYRKEYNIIFKKSEKK